MKVAVFDSHSYDRKYFQHENQKFGHELHFLDVRLTEQTVNLADGYPCVCAFVNDRLNAAVLKKLESNGTRLIALRSAGFNHVDLKEAADLGLKVVRVPEYSPYAVAEHTVALILSLNRKTHRAFNRVREGNFSLEGLVGFDLYQKTVGVIGTGKIGRVFATIMRGFGCEILAYDHNPDAELQASGIKYVSLNEICQKSDIISLHVPLNNQTRHLIDQKFLSSTKKGVMLINTGRGALIDTKALIANLKNGHVGSAGLDVYEEEEGVFFSDLSGQILQDDILARLMTFPNVLLTSHQAFLTSEALSSIANTTLASISSFESGQTLTNEVKFERMSETKAKP